jgi:hypothetical protein
MLERNLGTSSWSMSLNTSILGIVIVDSWLTWRGCKCSANGIQQREFYVALAEELFDKVLIALAAASVSALPTSQRRWFMAD